MSVENFLNINDFVCLFDETDEFKSEIAARLVQGGLRNNTNRINYPVV